MSKRRSGRVLCRNDLFLFEVNRTLSTCLQLSASGSIVRLNFLASWHNMSTCCAKTPQWPSQREAAVLCCQLSKCAKCPKQNHLYNEPCVSLLFFAFLVITKCSLIRTITMHGQWPLVEGNRFIIYCRYCCGFFIKQHVDAVAVAADIIIAFTSL